MNRITKTAKVKTSKVRAGAGTDVERDGALQQLNQTADGTGKKNNKTSANPGFCFVF